MDLDLWVYGVLALVGLLAGLIDSIAGGGALLSLPTLLIIGLDPISALSTNKLQGSFGTASATFAFWKRGLLRPQEHLATIACVLVGSALGVLLVSYAPRNTLSIIMPVLLVGVAIYFALAPRLSDEARAARLPLAAFTFGIAPVIGFYDGFFGPGTGSFFMLAQVSLFGLGLLEATARTKLFNFTSNIIALIIFIIGGHVIWAVGLVMGVAQFIGAQIGSQLAIRNGAAIIRPLLVLVCLVMAAKLFWENLGAYL